jgi:hypothetical protein
VNLRHALAGLVGLLPLAATALPGCEGPFFVDLIPEASWVNLDLTPEAGTSGIRDALLAARDQHPDRPVRIRLAPGFYADDLGSEIFAQRLLRGTGTPIHLVARDPTPDATRLGQGINLLGISYVAIEGVTIGPPVVGAWNGREHAPPLPLRAQAGIHVAGAARDGGRSAMAGGGLDRSVYGQFEPAHHVLIRSVTVQNLFEPTDFDAETAEGYGMDGIKFNQAEDVWVIGSRISQTTRHGIDNVGVHRGAYCRNVVARNGGGLGIEAKGGSTDILYESNIFHRVRRVELGGENTDATYYFSADGRWNYEALRLLARNNLIIDAREAALEFAGCSECAAIGNTILYSSDYQPPMAGSDADGGDGIRIHDSQVLGTADGAGSDCQTWDAAAGDYVTVDPCWGVGSRAPAPVGSVLRSAGITVAGNLFASAGGNFGRSLGGATVSCPYNATAGADLTFDANYWWNGDRPLPAEGCTPLPEGPSSVLSISQPTAVPQLAGTRVDGSSLDTLARSAPGALTPAPGSPLTGRGVVHPAGSAADARGESRPAPPAIGAIEPAPAFLPHGGLWVVDAENDGRPGRGFDIEVHGSTLVLTVFAYDGAGNGTFYQAAGPLNGQQFRGSLATFSGGRTFGGAPVSATPAGTAGPVALDFADATHGAVTFPGEPVRAISKFTWGLPTDGAGLVPRRGLWVIDAENDGRPGRGFSLEKQGALLVMTVFAYDADGRPAFYQAAGPLDGNRLVADLNRFRGGTSFGAPVRPAAAAGSVGQVAISFSGERQGEVRFPGETASAVGKFSW